MRRLSYFAHDVCEILINFFLNIHRPSKEVYMNFCRTTSDRVAKKNINYNMTRQNMAIVDNNIMKSWFQFYTSVDIDRVFYLFFHLSLASNSILHSFATHISFTPIIKLQNSSSAFFKSADVISLYIQGLFELMKWKTSFPRVVCGG